MNKILSVRHGAIAGGPLGRETEECFYLPVSGVCDRNVQLKLNGKTVEHGGEEFQAVAELTEKFNTITLEAANSDGVFTHSVKVLWDKKSFKRYNFFIDDNSFWCTEIAKTRPRSLFDHFFLKFLKRMHDEYGTKFTLNLFFRNDHDPDKFTLNLFPDCYRPEFADNADWLKMSWHAYSEFPDRPYQNAAPEKLAADFDLIKSEVIRFAGEKSFIAPAAAHWSMIRPEAMHVLTERGTRVQCGQFISAQTSLAEKGAPQQLCDIGYFRNLDDALYLKQKRMLYDFDSGLIFFRSHLICNYYKPELIAQMLRDAAAQNDPVISLETHEQYTFPGYFNFLPDHQARIESAIRTVTELGYKPVYFSEGLLGNTAWE